MIVGTTHFCDDCHTRQCKHDYVSKLPKDKLPKCPGPRECKLKIDHGGNGEEFSLGCTFCQNQKVNLKDF
jgi:E3 ubiquitin-protein ligase MYCBP2